MIIDPGDEADALLGARYAITALTSGHVLLTHAHIHHITGVALVKDALGAPVYLHEHDRPLYEHAVEQGHMFGFEVVQPPPVDVFYDMGRVYFGDYEVSVHHTPGHCPAVFASRLGRRARSVPISS